MANSKLDYTPENRRKLAETVVSNLNLDDLLASLGEAFIKEYEDSETAFDIAATDNGKLLSCQEEIMPMAADTMLRMVY